MVLPSYLSTKSAFHLSELAGRTSRIANEIDFFHRVLLQLQLQLQLQLYFIRLLVTIDWPGFAEKASPSCILFRIWLIVLIKSEIVMRREWSGRSVLTIGKRPKFVNAQKLTHIALFGTINLTFLGARPLQHSVLSVSGRLNIGTVFPMILETLPLLRFLKGVPGLR